MKKESKIAGFLFSAIFFIVFSFLFFDSFDQYPNLQAAYNLKTNGREVQATIYGFHIGNWKDGYVDYTLHYKYEEDGRSWKGTIRYSHKDGINEDVLIAQYESRIGDKVDVTIDPDSSNCMLTKDVETYYKRFYTDEVCQFIFGGVGLVATIVFFIVFLVKLKKSETVSKCTFIEDNKE